MKTFEELLSRAKSVTPKTVAVADIEEEVLIALDEANKKIGMKAFLIGNVDDVKKIASSNNVDLSKYELVNEPDQNKALRLSVRMVKEGKADILMKGLVQTSAFMRAVLDKEDGLVGDRFLSHFALFQIPLYHKLLAVTDVAINIAPNLEEKAKIIENAVYVFKKLSDETPLVACLAAVERVNPVKMPATEDAAILSKMAERGQIKNCIVDGPLAFDNCISMESVRIKKIKSKVAGNADIILCPNIETGNALYKCLNDFAQAKCAAIVAGAKAPIVLTSRADTHETKFLSIVLASLTSN
jgi:phosphate butyryltransferase